MQPTSLHPNAQTLTEADLLAIADPLDDDGFLDFGSPTNPEGVTTSADLAPPNADQDFLDGMMGKDYQSGELLDPRAMGEGFKGSKFYVPPESSEDVAAAGLANALGPIANHQQVIVYDCRVRPQPVQKAKLRYYLTKPCGEVGHKHRAFYVTEAKAIQAVGLRYQEPVADIPCKARRCATRAGNRKMFSSVDAMEEHFRLKHKREFARFERERTREREERMIAAQERNADLMAALIQTVQGGATVQAGNGDSTPEPAAPAAAEETHIHPAAKAEAAAAPVTIPEGRPTMEWKVVQTAAWLDGHGIARPEKLGGVSREALLALVPPEGE